MASPKGVVYMVSGLAKHLCANLVNCYFTWFVNEEIIFFKHVEVVYFGEDKTLFILGW